jgi:hypothetical protein
VIKGQHGGYRKPSNPAPVSGPGAMSKRTDGGPTQPSMEVGGFEYGGRQDFMDIQGGAPLAAASDAPAESFTPLFNPTERPNEPITAGAPVGPGPGPTPTPTVKSLSAKYYAIAERDESGDALRIADILAARGL